MRVTKEQNRNKGITLIALIITIIVMLTLVAVTITTAVNGGLFEYAGRAGRKTNEAIANEQLLAAGGIMVDGETYASIDDFLNKGKKLTGPWYYCDKNGKEKNDATNGYITNADIIIPIGTMVNYTPDVLTDSELEELCDTVKSYSTGYALNQSLDLNPELVQQIDENSKLNWRVLDITDEGEVRLISEVPTQSNIYLAGFNGYNNGVYLLNLACNTLYSNEELGVSATNIKIEDIESKVNETVKSSLEEQNTALRIRT